MANIRMKDIAERLGISTATVSMALNDRPGVNAQTKERVLELVRELNYTGATGTKKAATTGVISLIIYKRYGRILADTQFFSDLLESLTQSALAEHYTLTLNYANGPEHLTDALAAALAADPAGIIFLGTEMGEEDTAAFADLSVPLVVLDCELMGADYDSVTISNVDGIWRAMHYLYDAGHRDIGYLQSSFPIRNFEQRRMSYEFSLRALNLPYEERRLFLLAPTVEGAAADMAEILARGVALPTALVADNDLIALGAMKALKDYGLTLPDDISIVGFDDIPMGTLVEPALTSISVSRSALGSAAIETLLWRLEHPAAPPRRIAVGNDIVLRASVRELN